MEARHSTQIFFIILWWSQIKIKFAPMLKKTLAIATFWLIGLSILVPWANAVEEDIPTDTENALQTELNEESTTPSVADGAEETATSQAEPTSGEIIEVLDTSVDSEEVMFMMPDVNIEAISDDILMPSYGQEEASETESGANVELTSPSSETEEIELSEEVVEELEESADNSDWDYSGDGAPENWGKLRDEYKLCEVGEMQSPIDLDTADFESQTPIELNYAVTTFEVVNTGHSIQVNYPAGSTAMIGEKTYGLQQFHFHTPSEHTINGQYAEMEIHLVHTNNEGEIAVISSMIEAGDESYDVSKIWKNIPALNESRRSGLVLNPMNFIAESMTHATYLGSLTTPPCSENVSWVVMAEPITLSQEQIETFQSLYPMDARPIQRQ